MKNSLPNYLTFCLIFLLYITTSLYINSNIITDDLYLTTFGEDLSDYQLFNFIDKLHKYTYLSFFVLFLILAIKIILIGLIIYMIISIEEVKKISLNNIFNIVIISESIFIIPIIIKIIWFTYFQKNYTLEEVHLYFPLSILSLLNVKNIDPIWAYPFQTINLFEIAYCFSLSYGIYKVSNQTFTNSFSLVMKSYLSALIIWISLIMFLTVLLLPT